MRRKDLNTLRPISASRGSVHFRQDFDARFLYRFALDNLCRFQTLGDGTPVCNHPALDIGEQ